MKIFQLMKAAHHLLAVKPVSDKQLVLIGSVQHSELFQRAIQQLLVIIASSHAEIKLQNLEDSMLSVEPSVVLKDIMDFKSSIEMLKRNVKSLVPRYQKKSNSPVSGLIFIISCTV